jgi:hypothetical protein
MPAKGQPESEKNAYLKYSSLALQWLITLGVFGWVGYWLDGYLGLAFPVFMLLFGFLAFTGLMIQLYRSINKP